MVMDSPSIKLKFLSKQEALIVTSKPLPYIRSPVNSKMEQPPPVQHSKQEVVLNTENGVNSHIATLMTSLLILLPSEILKNKVS